MIGRARSSVVCKLQHAARRRSTPHAARVCTVQCGISAKSQGRPIGPVLFALFRFGKADAQTSDGFCVFPSSSTQYFMAGRFFSLSLFGFVVFTTLQFRDEDVPPCESGLRGPPVMYFFITFGSGFGFSATLRGPLVPLRLTLRGDLLSVIVIYCLSPRVRGANLIK